MKTIVLKWDELDKNGRKVFHPTGKRGELKDARPGDVVIQDDGRTQIVSYNRQLWYVKVIR